MAEQSISEWVSQHVPRLPGENWENFIGRRREAVDEYKKTHPNAPAQPPNQERYRGSPSVKRRRRRTI